jgi:hypothetical protein
MIRAATAGLVYFLIVFAAGFALGTLRVLLLAPHVGALPAVVLELPVMLAVSWVACRWTIGWFRVPGTLIVRVTMGLVAFTCLMLAEYAVGVFGFGRTLAQHVAHYGTAPALAGLLAQIAFAAVPVLVGKPH